MSQIPKEGKRWQAYTNDDTHFKLMFGNKIHIDRCIIT